MLPVKGWASPAHPPCGNARVLHSGAFQVLSINYQILFSLKQMHPLHGVWVIKFFYKGQVPLLVAPYHPILGPPRSSGQLFIPVQETSHNPLPRAGVVLQKVSHNKSLPLKEEAVGLWVNQFPISPEIGILSSSPGTGCISMRQSLSLYGKSPSLPLGLSNSGKYYLSP